MRVLQLELTVDCHEEYTYIFYKVYTLYSCGTQPHILTSFHLIIYNKIQLKQLVHCGWHIIFIRTFTYTFIIINHQSDSL